MPLARYLSILFLLIISAAVNGQVTDSLKKVLESHKKKDTARVEILVTLASKLKNKSPDEALDFAIQALETSQQLRYETGIANSYFQIGSVYENKDNYPAAIRYFQLCLKAAENAKDTSRIISTLNKIGGCQKELSELDKAHASYKKALGLAYASLDSSGIGASYTNIGLVFKERNKPDSAVHYFNKALLIKEKLGEKGGVAGALYNIGILHIETGEYKEGLDFMLKSEQPMFESGNERGYATVINGIGALYFYQKEYEKALEYFNKAKLLYEELHDRSGISDAVNNMANIYIEQKKLDEAISCFRTCLEIEKEIGNTVDKASAMMNLAAALRVAKAYDEARSLLLDALKLLEKTDSKKVRGHAYRNYGNLLVETGKPAQGIAYITDALEIMKELNLRTEIMDTYESLALAYSKAGDHKQAYAYSLQHVIFKDSIYNESNSEQIKELTAKHETEKKEKEIQLLTQRTSIQDLEIKKKKWFLYSSIGGGLLVLIITGLLFSRFRIRQRSNKELETQNNEILRRKHIIEEKNKEITSSIYFAKRIQDNILPPEKYIRKYLPKTTVMYRPKDIVSGDFYFFEQVGDLSIIAAADCTGHGVPGAFMSMIGHDVLEQAVKQHSLTQPSLILNYLSKSINAALRQEGQESAIKDGMDIALCTIDTKKMELQYSGAFNPLYHIRGFELKETKADKFAIGSYFDATKHSFTNHTIKLQKGDSVFFFSDGYSDQFGGEMNKKFKMNRFKSLLVGISEQDPSWQLEVLNHSFDEWKGNNEQVDDILVIGIKF